MNLKELAKNDWDKWYFRVKVMPASYKTELYSILDDWTLKIRLKAPPEKWKANKELIKFFSKELWVKEQMIKIISWLTDKIKLIRVDF